MHSVRNESVPEKTLSLKHSARELSASVNSGHNMETLHRKINHYYDSPAVQFFEQLTGEQIHLGYWDPRYPSLSPAQAAQRLTSVIIHILNPGSDAHILDIGCGSGMPAIEIMQQTGCRVDGITLNYAQQQKAICSARKAKLAHKCHFILGDAAKLPYPDNYFDFTLLLESIHHIGHDQAISEAGRVLKPGGAILIADALVMTETGTSEDQQWLAQTFVSQSQLTLQEISETLTLNGFGQLEVIELTQAIQPSWKKLMLATRQYKSQICQEYGADIYEQMLEFWSQIDFIWSKTARYLIFKAYKL